jgi:molybdopterin-guanine dinucleotide biosynthesis protein A
MRRGAIILCGGQSSRMGRDKASLPFHGEPMLERVIRLVSEVIETDRIVCVASADQSLPSIAETVQVARDRTPNLGPLEGLAVGLAALEGDAQAAFVTSCDVPLLVPAFVERMFEFLGDDQITAPHDGEKFHPLSAVYRVDVLPSVEALLAGDKRSMMGLLENCRTRKVTAEDLREVDPRLNSLVNCNDPADYERALEVVAQ